MLESLKNQFLGSLDPKIVYVCLAVLAVLIILTLIKKAIKIAIVLAILGVVIYSVVPMAKNFQNDYKFSIDSKGVLTVTVEGKELVLDNTEKRFDDDIRVDKLEVKRESSGEYALKIYYTDGTAQAFTVPGFMRTNLINYLDKHGFKYKVLE